MQRARFSMIALCFAVAAFATMPASFAQPAPAAPPAAGQPAVTGQVHARKSANPSRFYLQRHGWWYLGPALSLNHVTGPVPSYYSASSDNGGPQAELAPPPLFAGPPPVFAGPPPIVSFGIRFNAK
ncbi:hypothetical protein AiwAL_07220 [Acidiphilium sp. AL]|uniref:hypothetical protein n=1 Tax=Acidiphilium sp. AL TaxID=2871704 RepID=UPI0021CB43D3|nr:hypothetical protein [Acidiphilium sp. AL]MCU4159895.1 hypothetical protein [Acidiphilium sp. AL]